MSESTASFIKAATERFCTGDLSTYDSYDVWKTPLGFRVKDLYNRRPRLALAPAGVLTLFDCYVNNRARLFYRRQEYPIVRAMAAMCLLHLWKKCRRRHLLEACEEHLEWLRINRSHGYSGHCWGLGFPHTVSRGVVYNANTPFTTITPYALEAFLQHTRECGSSRFDSVVRGIRAFYENDVRTMREDGEILITSYGPFRDRVVTNAVSYTMYAWSLLLPAGSSDASITTRIRKMYTFVRRAQLPGGGWFYSPEGRPFIDCFHSCIVMKNLVKTASRVPLDGAAEVIEAGWAYLESAFLDRERMLFRRFSLSNKIGLIRFDLYDNAEALNLALLLGKNMLAARLLESILANFRDGDSIYSQIDVTGRRRNRNTLRWAVMPFLYAASRMATL